MVGNLVLCWVVKGSDYMWNLLENVWEHVSIRTGIVFTNIAILGRCWVYKWQSPYLDISHFINVSLSNMFPFCLFDLDTRLSTDLESLKFNNLPFFMSDTSHEGHLY